MPKPTKPAKAVKPKQKFYSLDKISKLDATYNVIFGERSNGKTYALLKKSLTDFVTTGSQMAYVRRWKEDVTGRRASALFAGITANGVVEELTKGAYTGIHYYAGKFYLCTYDDNGKVIYSDQDIMGYAFAISEGEHNKSTSYPNIRNIVFDEFLTNKTYLPDEFVLFMNTVSTIVRRREDVKIWMLGNTVNRFCPYFTEMGLTNVQKQKQGTIDLYNYGASTLTVAVEYCAPSSSSDDEAHKYFAFNNPKLHMITGGAWELSIYPHLPMKYKPKDVYLTYFIEFSEQLFQCEVVVVDEVYFTYIHRKTTPIKHPEDDLIFTLDHNPRLNYNRNILRPVNKVQEKLLWFFKTDRVFYQDNEVGDAINNYIQICRSF